MTMTIRDAGIATTREVADHWGVCADTARRLLREAGAEPVDPCALLMGWTPLAVTLA